MIYTMGGMHKVVSGHVRESLERGGSYVRKLSLRVAFCV